MRFFVLFLLLSCGSSIAPQQTEPPTEPTSPHSEDTEQTEAEETSSRPELRVVYQSRVELERLRSGRDLDPDSVELLEGDECNPLMRHPLTHRTRFEGARARMVSATATTCEGEVESPELRGTYRQCEGCGDGGLMVTDAQWTVSARVRGCEEFPGIIAILNPTEHAQFVVWEEGEHPLRERLVSDGTATTYVAELDNVHYGYVTAYEQDESDCLRGEFAFEGGDVFWGSESYIRVRPILLGSLGDALEGVPFVVVQSLGTQIQTRDGVLISGGYVPDMDCPGC